MRRKNISQRKIRHRRVRAKVSGTSDVPRICVYRSSKHIYAQLIDDSKGVTLVSITKEELKAAESVKKSDRTTKVTSAYEIGKIVAKKAQDKGITQAVFDRGGYKYHGRVKAIAEGAREGGIKV
jgi:large subunit ribosomal protein L18